MTKVYSVSRTIRPYIDLFEISQIWLEIATNEEEGNLYNCIVSMVFCAFSLEAYLNHLGSIKLENWNSIERKICREGKLKKICNLYNVSINKRKTPYRYFDEILDFRDQIVHAKTEIFTDKTTKINLNKKRPELPEAKWEKMANSDRAGEFVKHTKEIIISLHKLTGASNNPFGSPYSGSWSSE